MQRIIAGEDNPRDLPSPSRNGRRSCNKNVEGFVFNPINLGTYDLHKLSKS